MEAAADSQSLPTLLGSRANNPEKGQKQSKPNQRPAPKPLLDIPDEGPAPAVAGLRIRNTFIDSAVQRSPSLEAVYREREVRTCPSKHIGRLSESGLFQDPGSLSQGDYDPIAAVLGMPQASPSGASGIPAMTPGISPSGIPAGIGPGQWSEMMPGFPGFPYDYFSDIPVGGALQAPLGGGDASFAPPLGSSLWPPRPLGFQDGLAASAASRTPLSLERALAAAPPPFPPPPPEPVALERPPERVVAAAAAVAAAVAAPRAATPPPSPASVVLENTEDAAREPTPTPTPPGQVPPSEWLPSIGSAGHDSGACKPCAFLHTKGCSNAYDCQFCHLCLPGEKKRRQRDKLELLKKTAKEAGIVEEVVPRKTHHNRHWRKNAPKARDA